MLLTVPADHSVDHAADSAAVDVDAEALPLADGLDLDLCEALYWVRRARARRDAAMAERWTARLDALLDRVPRPAAA